MFASVKKLLITLVILTVAAFIGVLLYSYNRTYLNDENLIGNSTGNIYNGGLFCERNGKIYFSNDNDDGSLYVMRTDLSNIKKIHNDKVAYINVDENYIYYVRANNTRANNSGSVLTFNNTGIYRINQNGANIKAITSKPSSYLTLRGNHVYFQKYDVTNGLFLYRNKTDATLERLLIESAAVPTDVINNKLYFSGYSDIETLDLSSFTVNTAYEGSYVFPIITGDYVYYLDRSNNYSINRMNLNGSNKTVLVNERCFTYNITNTGKFLYYQVDDGENNRISRLNLETMVEETLLEGNYKQIHVTDRYVFFKDFNNEYTYVLSADGSSKLGTFEPPKFN